MKREDFKEILPIHIDSCKEIVRQRGKCKGVSCANCPFYALNINSVEFDCERIKFYDIFQVSKEFIELFEKDFQPKKTLGEEIKKDVEKTVRAICEATPGVAKTVEDNVNQPNHYKLDGLDVEVLDIIKAVLTKEQFEGFLHGNVIKYTLRTNKKNGVEDLEKAHKYLVWLIDSKNGLKLNK